MSENKTQKRGLALGAIFAIVASGFTAAVPASATPSTDAFTIVPATGSTFDMFVDEDFTIVTARKGTAFDSADFSKLKYSITTNRSGANNSTYSLRVLAKAEASSVQTDVSTSAAALFGAGNTSLSDYGDQRIYYVNSYAINGNSDNLAYYATSIRGGFSVTATTISPTLKFDSNDFSTAAAQGETVATSSFVIAPHSVNADLSNKLSIQLYAPHMTSASPSVTVTVTAFIDLNGNNVFDASTEPSKVQAINFKRYSEVVPSVTMAAPTRGTMYVTASAAVSGINFNQAEGKFFFNFYSGYDNQQHHSGVAVASFSALIALTEATAAAGRLSASKEIAPAVQAFTFSAQVGYSKDGTAALTDVLWAPRAAVTVATPGLDTLRMQLVPGDNLTAGGSARPNSTYTVRAATQTLSGAVTASAVAVEFTFAGTGVLSANQTLKVNSGVPATTSHAPVTVTSDANGFATLTLVATGYANGETIVVTATAGGYSATTTLTMDDVGSSDYVLENDLDILSVAPSGTVVSNVSVTDQYGVSVTSTDLRVKFTKTGAFNFGSSTDSFAVVAAGSAAGSIVATSVTGSMPVTQTLQKWNTSLNRWEDMSATGDTSVQVWVTTDADGFMPPSGLAASYSASISYAVSGLSWSALIDTLDTRVTGSAAVLSSNGLIFLDENTGKTASDTITIRSNSDRELEFRVTARKAGTYTLTVTVGAASTTSLIVVSPARSDAGSTITWDTTTIEAGKTKVVTGTLTDVNGNPVYTDGPGTEVGGLFTTASITVTYLTSAGIPVGSMPTETDVDGKFKISILTTATDAGTFTLTATYNKNGVQTAVGDRITSVQAITVTAVAAPEVNAVIGSFNGRWAVRVENAKGSVVSVKVGGNWFKYTSLNDNYLFSRKSRVGATIAVSVWVDGELQNSQTITVR